MDLSKLTYEELDQLEQLVASWIRDRASQVASELGTEEIRDLMAYLQAVRSEKNKRGIGIE